MTVVSRYSNMNDASLEIVFFLEKKNINFLKIVHVYCDSPLDAITRPFSATTAKGNYVL